MRPPVLRRTADSLLGVAAQPTRDARVAPLLCVRERPSTRTGGGGQRRGRRSGRPGDGGPGVTAPYYVEAFHPVPGAAFALSTGSAASRSTARSHRRGGARSSPTVAATWWPPARDTADRSGRLVDCPGTSGRVRPLPVPVGGCQRSRKSHGRRQAVSLRGKACRAPFQRLGEPRLAGMADSSRGSAACRYMTCLICSELHECFGRRGPGVCPRTHVPPGQRPCAHLLRNSSVQNDWNWR